MTNLEHGVLWHSIVPSSIATAPAGSLSSLTMTSSGAAGAASSGPPPMWPSRALACGEAAGARQRQRRLPHLVGEVVGIDLIARGRGQLVAQRQHGEPLLFGGDRWQRDEETENQPTHPQNPTSRIRWH